MGCSSSNQHSLISNQTTLWILCVPAATAQTPFRPHSRSSVGTRGTGRETLSPAGGEGSRGTGGILGTLCCGHWASCSHVFFLLNHWPQTLPAFLGLDASFLGWVV